MLGWIPFTLVDCPVDEVNNPRPEWLQAKKEKKQYIAHWIDDYQTGACKKAKNYSSSMTFERTSIAVENIDETTSTWVKSAVPCKECYKLWKERKN